MVAWDEKYHIHSNIRLIDKEQSQTEIHFKGIKVSRSSRIRRKSGISSTFDVYGLETKDTLALDRASFVNPGRDIIQERIGSTTDFYLDRVLEELCSSSTRLAEICSTEKFNVYAFWRLCSPAQRAKIPKECYNYVKEQADVIRRSSDGEYVLTTKPVRDILMYDGKTYFAWYRDYDALLEDNNKFCEICNLLNAKAVNHVDELVVDRSLTSVNGRYMWEHMIKPIEDNSLIIYTTGAKICCDVTPEFRKCIISGLAGPIPNMHYYGELINDRKYYAIPAVSGYEDIAVTYVPRGVGMPYANTNLILAPFTSLIGRKISEMSKEMFIDSVISDARYERIIAFVQKNSAKREKPTDSQIRECYQKLLEEFWDAKVEIK